MIKDMGPSPAEKQLQQAVQAGLVADFGSRPVRPTVRAEVVRRLLLGIPLEPSTQTGGIEAVSGVRIRGAVIDGTLDLEDAVDPQGVDLPSLVLEGCVIREPVNLKNVKIQRLSLANSEVRRIDGAGLRSAGLVDLCGVRPVPPSSPRDPEPPVEVCEVDLQHAHLEGGLKACGARLVAHVRGADEPRDRSSGDTIYALNLANAVVVGDLMLQPEFKARGGVSFHGATIRGDVWLDGAELIGVEGDGLRGQGARIAGSLVFRPDKRPDGGTLPVRVEGGAGGARAIWLMAAEIEGGVWIGWSVAEGEDGRSAVHGDVVLDMATVAGQVSILGLAQPEGDVSLFQARIDGNVSVEHLDQDGGGLSLGGARIGGDLTVANLKQSMEGVRLQRARIEGTAAILESRLGAIWGDDLTVGDDLYLCSRRGHYDSINAKDRRPSPDEEDEDAGLRVGVVWMQEMQIGGSFFIDGLHGARRVELSRIATGGLFLVASSHFGDLLRIEGCRVGADLSFKSTHVDGLLNADRSRIEGSLRIEGCELRRGSSFEGVEARGSVLLDDTALGRRGGDGTARDGDDPLRADHSFKNFVAGGELFIREIHPIRSTPPIPITSGFQALSGSADRFFRHRLTCYPEWDVVEAVASPSSGAGPPGRMAFLWSDAAGGRSARIWPLDGTSPPIHRLNHKSRPLLAGEREVTDYLKFFCGYVWGEGGPFRILEDPAHLPGLVPLDDEEDEGGTEEGRDGEHEVAPEGEASDDEPAPEDLAARIGPVRVTLLKSGDATARAEAKAVLVYDSTLFDATFRILPTGMVEMVDDEAFARVVPPFEERYEHPLRLPAPEQPVIETAIPDRAWTEVTDSRVKEAMREALRALAGGSVKSPYLSELENVVPGVDLSNASFSRLNDRDGVAWGRGFTLKLDGLTYERAPRREGGFRAPERSVEPDSAESPALRGEASRADDRLSFLDLQYPTGEPTSEDFRPQPYEVAAGAFRNEGAMDNARRVLSHKLSLEAKLKQSWISGQAWRLYGLTFDYGLSPRRALTTLLVVWLVGWMFVSFANRMELLVVDFTPTSGLVIEEPAAATAPERPALRFAVVPAEGVGASTVVLCGDMIFEAFYALDVMVPVLDFYQEKACKIRSSVPPLPETSPLNSVQAGEGRMQRLTRAAVLGVRGAILSPRLWAFLKTAYSILGAVVVSFAILTFSGLARRHVEG